MWRKGDSVKRPRGKGLQCGNNICHICMTLTSLFLDLDQLDQGWALHTCNCCSCSHLTMYNQSPLSPCHLFLLDLHQSCIADIHLSYETGCWGWHNLGACHTGNTRCQERNQKVLFSENLVNWSSEKSWVRRYTEYSLLFVRVFVGQR